MPIIKSAKKRVRVTKKATSKNMRTKRSLRAAIKNVRLSVSGSNKQKLEDAKRKAQSAFDKAAKKGLMSKHKVARKQSQLSAQVKASGTTSTVTKKKLVKKHVKPTKKLAK